MKYKVDNKMAYFNVIFILYKEIKNKIFKIAFKKLDWNLCDVYILTVFTKNVFK